MFPSSNTINPSLHSSQFIFLPFPPFLPQNENNVAQQNHEIFQNPKKRTKRKDRHSKIYTAHGLRDRRVRLSVDIARKFFKLQDILRFNKASQTISWLLKNAESSIKELNQNQSLDLDGFENISPISETSEGGGGGASERNNFLKSKENKVNRQESRNRARARARERTRGKIMSTQRIDEMKHSILSRSNSLIGEIEVCEGMVGDVTKGSPLNPNFENPLSIHKDWDKNLFTEFEVFSQYFEACNH